MSLRASSFATAAATAAVVGCALLAPSAASAAPLVDAAAAGQPTGSLQMWEGSAHYRSGQFVVANTTDRAADWSLTFTVPHGTFQNHSDWNVDAEVHGDQVTLSPKSGTLAAGMSEYVSFGIAGDGTTELGVAGCDLGGAGVQGCSAGEEAGEAPTAPGDVRVTDVAHDRATVRWTPSTDDEHVLGYTVSVFQNGEIIRQHIAPGSDRTSQVVDRLQAYRNYDIVVAAYDTDGNETAAEAVELHTTPDPSLPDPTAPKDIHVNAQESRRVIVNWNSPAHPDLLAHAVNLYQDGRVIRQVPIGNPLQASVIVDRLTPGTAYQVEVLAQDVHGHESASERVTFTTAAEVR
jgi:hypothetical protein